MIFRGSKKLLPKTSQGYYEVKLVSIKLIVDGKEIPLNDFVGRFIQGVVVGGVSSLKGIKDDWKKIEVVVTK